MINNQEGFQRGLRLRRTRDRRPDELACQWSRHGATRSWHAPLALRDSLGPELNSGICDGQCATFNFRFVHCASSSGNRSALYTFRNNKLSFYYSMSIEVYHSLDFTRHRAPTLQLVLHFRRRWPLVKKMLPVESCSRVSAKTYFQYEGSEV